MALEIKIHHIRLGEVFYGGDEVTGFLKVWGPLNVPDAIVKVLFRGCSDTKYHLRNRTLHDEQRFFQTPIDLFQGAIDLQADQVQTYPFRLLLPDNTEASWAQPRVKYCDKKGIRDKKLLFAQGPHSLPPSMAGSGSLPHPWSAQVYYSLYAEVKGKRNHLHKEGIVTLVPSPTETKNILEKVDTEHDAQSKTFTHASSRLLEGNTDKRRSFGTWLSDRSSSKSPKAVFDFTARTATVLSSGQGIPIQITLNYDSAASNLPSIPEFKLMEMKYKLRAVTNCVSRGTLAPNLYVNDTTTVFKRQIRFAQMTLTNGQVLDIGYIDTEQGGLHQIHFDEAAVPPFMSYNISRRYFIEITIAFECGEKQMAAEFKWDDVKVVFNEAYHMRAPTQFSAQSDTLEGAVGAAKVVAVTALTIAAVLGA